MVPLEKGYGQFLIIQEDLSSKLSEEIAAAKAMVRGEEYHPPVPKTIAIPVSKYSWIKKYSQEHMFGSDRGVQEALLVPEETVRLWGLLNGDMVVFETSRGPSSISQVNGFTNPDLVRERPRLITDLLSEYAKSRLPIEDVQLPKPEKRFAPNGSISNRALTILAPLPKGGRCLLAAPPNAGKSTALRFVYEALLNLLNNDDNLFVIALQVGERPEDATELVKIRNHIDHDLSRSELYLAPAGDSKEDPLEGHYWLAKYVKDRAERLTQGTKDRGYDVVLLIDSMSRVMMSHSFSDKIEKTSHGALSQGLNPKSLVDTSALLNVAGRFGEHRSLTIISTMLKQDDINTRRRVRSAEHVLYDQSGPSVSTCIWGFVNSSKPELRPSIDLSITETRQIHEISSPGQLDERGNVMESMWNPGRAYTGDGSYDVSQNAGSAEKALAYLLSYAEQNPKFQETQFHFINDG